MPIISQPDEGWDGTEFALDPAGLQGVAGQVGRVYDDVNDAITDWSDAIALSAQALGDPKLASVYSGFVQVWSPETNATGLALGELVKNLSTAKQLYEETDHASAGQFDRLRGA
ncbi:uncharacterized protein YukE [Nocardia sp. GAS34]|uniref:hypothetical protein n=1 Tax=unclassified Nocardia TaxID=2637762 RepID=UPI003D1BC30B